MGEKQTTKHIQKAPDIDYTGYNKTPIYNNQLEQSGWHYRAIKKHRIPKAIIKCDMNYCCLHFPRIITKTYAVLVEDKVSAEILAETHPTIALLGCNINQEKINYIIQQKIKQIILLLDNDAAAVAIRLKKKYPIIETIIVPEVDIKDMNQAQLTNLHALLERKIHA